MNASPKRYLRSIFAMVLLLGSFGCGGSDTFSTAADATNGTTGGTTGGTTLSWIPPTSYNDGTNLSPAVDLSEYVIYVNTTGQFSDSDEMAVLSPVRTDGGLVTSFDLANLEDKLVPGLTYYVSMQSVTNSGIKSGFSPSATFAL